MSNQPEALRLADALEDACLPTFIAEEAADELRRLHAENERIGPLAERVLELKAQRDALLEALKEMLEVWEDDPAYGAASAEKARTAIAKAEEQT